MRRSLLQLVLLSSLLGCGESCGCEGESAQLAAAPTPIAAPKAPALTRGDAGAKRVISEDKQLEDPELRAQIEAARAEVDWQADLGALIEPEKLGAALPDQLGSFKARAPSAVAQRTNGEADTQIAVREYDGGTRNARIKITDTANVPALRASLDERLLVVSGAGSGNQHGAVIAGAPGIEAFHEKARISRAVALLQGRYLVEIIVRETDEAGDARKLLEAIKPPASARKPKARK